MQLDTLLMELSKTPGVSGYEDPVRETIRAHWEPLADSIEVDALGNLLATRYGSGPEPRPRVLIAAHMDQIGMMVTRIEDQFLRITSVGGIDARVLLSQPVTVHATADGPRALAGLIGSRPPHVLPASARKEYPDLDDLVVDTGIPARQLAKLVQIGDIVTFAAGTAKLGENLVSGPAMDNRASVVAATRVLHSLTGRDHAWDVIVAATVQEEVGLRGAQVTAWHTLPDVAIAVDTTWGVGTGVSEDKGFKLGSGPSLVIGPNAHPKLFAHIREVASTLEISVTPEPMERSSGTDGYAIQISREGVPTAILGIPIRNMHMPVEIVHIKDIERTARLVTETVCGFDDTTLTALALD